MKFDNFKKICRYRSIQNYINGEEVLNFCTHKFNPFNTEGNCNIENCKEIKKYTCKCQGFYKHPECPIHTSP